MAEPNISAWRGSVCGDLTSCFDFTSSEHDDPRSSRHSGYAPPCEQRSTWKLPHPTTYGKAGAPESKSLARRLPGRSATSLLPTSGCEEKARLHFTLTNGGAATVPIALYLPSQ